VSKNKKGCCSRCGLVWCDEHNSCPVDCAELHRAEARASAGAEAREPDRSAGEQNFGAGRMKRWHRYIVAGIGYCLFPRPETYHWWHPFMRYIVAGIGYCLFPWPETYHWWHPFMRVAGFTLIMLAGAAAGIDRRRGNSGN